MTSRTLARTIAELVLTKKGFDVTILDLRRVTTTTDYFVLCSADSDTQVRAIAEAVEEGTEQEGVRCWHREGLQALSWVLLDYVDVVVHVFQKEARTFYNLERLWNDAAIADVIDDPKGVKIVERKEPKPGKKAEKKSAKAKKEKTPRAKTRTTRKKTTES